MAASLEHESFATFERLLHDQEVQVTPTPSPVDLVHFRYGEVLLIVRLRELAAKEFLAAANTLNANPGIVTMAHLRAAQTLDLIGKRDDAIAQYRAVLRRPSVYDSYEEARRGLREPYRE